ncbi:MAG: response regulator [Thiohalobacterales bacterium]|nr:response regulator [Thiohalobacterales bacterium]
MPDKPRVMLVDDDRDLLRLLSMRLSAAGYEVMAMASGEEALAELPGRRPDVMVTDLQLDGMDGMTLFKHVHEMHPALPVLVLTAHGTIPDAFDAANRGVFSYLTKPFNSKILLSHLERALDAGRHEAESPSQHVDNQTVSRFEQ